MVKNLTQGTIDFTVNTSEAVGGFSTKRTNASLLENNKYSVSTKQGLIDSGYESQGGFSINAVDIDWNNATLEINGQNTYINTTGELLALIKSMADRIEQLENGMLTISNAVIQQVLETTPTENQGE